MNKKNKSESKLDEIFIKAILEQKKNKPLPKNIDEKIQEEIKLNLEKVKKFGHGDIMWEELCTADELILGREVRREIIWALHGMDFAYGRLSLFYIDDFERYFDFVKKIYDYLDIGGGSGELNHKELMGFRSVLILYAIQEFYFWISSVWDRMAHLLSLFAFNMKNISRSTEYWRTSFDRFENNYGDIDDIANDGDYKIIKKLTKSIYWKAQRRRNILAHKGSLTGRIQAVRDKSPGDFALYKKFILGNETWNLSDVISESQEICEKCWDAVWALDRFVGTFLMWKKHKQVGEIEKFKKEEKKRLKEWWSY